MNQWHLLGPEDRLVLLPPEGEIIQAHAGGLELDEALTIQLALEATLRVPKQVTIEDRLKARCTRLGWRWRTRFMSILKNLYEMTEDPEQFVPLVLAGILWLPISAILIGGHLIVLLCLFLGIRPFNWPEGPEWPDRAITWAHGLVGHRWKKDGEWNEGRLPEGEKEWRPGARRRILLKCDVCLSRTSKLVRLGGNPEKCW